MEQLVLGFSIYSKIIVSVLELAKDYRQCQEIFPNCLIMLNCYPGSEGSAPVLKVILSDRFEQWTRNHRT